MVRWSWKYVITLLECIHHLSIPAVCIYIYIYIDIYYLGSGVILHAIKPIFAIIHPTTCIFFLKIPIAPQRQHHPTMSQPPIFLSKEVGELYREFTQ